MEHEQFLSYENAGSATDRPALLIGDHPASIAEARDLLASAGIRIGAACALSEAESRLDRQLSAGLIWAELGDALPEDALLVRLSRLAESGTAVVVAVSRAMIDPMVAALPEIAQILVEPDAIERASALALALAEQSRSTIVSDVGRDNAVRLRQLSDEVGRIAATLARLSSVPERSGRGLIEVPSAQPAGIVDVEQVRGVIRARRLRARFFSEQLFADPAWDMLLDLFQAEIAQHRVPVSSLCIAAAVPATTALRWIRTMTDAGIFLRRADPHDGRRIFVELSPGASTGMRQYFAEAGAVAGL